MTQMNCFLIPLFGIDKNRYNPTYKKQMINLKKNPPLLRYVHKPCNKWKHHMIFTIIGINLFQQLAY